MNPRLEAVQVALRVVDGGESLTNALPPGQEALEDERDRALVQELSYGVIRWHIRLEALTRKLLRSPLRARDLDVELLLETGLYQLIHTRIPAYATIHETVESTRVLGKPWASGLVNAVLRRFAREGEALTAGLDKAEPAIRFSMPPWLVKEFERAYPSAWSRICAESNVRPPMILRPNRMRVVADVYVEMLRSAGLEAESHPMVPGAVTLSNPVAVDQLPGFSDGLVSVQDAAAQLAAPLLEGERGLRVLDACAAPGGKTAHLLEAAGGDIDLAAVDVDPVRMARVSDTLSRLGLEAKLIVADAAVPEAWWDGRRFDRILLDAPCSATGVIRRHPDIKLHRRPEDLEVLAKRQDALLAALWPLLEPGGMLLYVTCSILPQENVQRVLAFMANHADAEERRIESSDWGCACQVGRQILPGEAGMDGFYYARITKKR